MNAHMGMGWQEAFVTHMEMDGHTGEPRIILRLAEDLSRCVSFTVEPHQARALLIRLQDSGPASEGKLRSVRGPGGSSQRDIYSAYVALLEAGNRRTMGFRISMNDYADEYVEAIRVKEDGEISTEDLSLGIGDVLVLSVCMSARLFVNEHISSRALGRSVCRPSEPHSIQFAHSPGA